MPRPADEYGTFSIAPGDRVGVYHYNAQGAPYLMGYGRYDGRRMPDITDDAPGDNGWTDLFDAMGGNPHLTLDDGRELWGFECFWGPAERVAVLFPDAPKDVPHGDD
jgi:hypothetical protein